MIEIKNNGLKTISYIIFSSAAWVGTTQAQTYPARSIRLIAPFAAGGGTDLIARTLARQLTDALGQSVVVDNRSGANAVIGTEIAAKSPPDGYTIMIATPTLTVNPSLVKNLPYDAIRDFAPVSLVASSPHLLAVHPSLPAKSVKELVALAKARPGTLTYASGATGGSSHLSAELFSTAAGIKMVNVPYRGTGQAVMAIVSGEVTMGFNDVMTNLPQMKAGRLRGIAVTSPARSPAVTDLPTIAESGYPGFQSGVWYGVLAPAKTPADIITRLNNELVKISRSAAFAERLQADGGVPIGSTPEYFGDFIKQETARWARVIANAQLKVE
jgi:tripartite-type tricarboxylate transporter receptor subunit TctC